MKINRVFCKVRPYLVLLLYFVFGSLVYCPEALAINSPKTFGGAVLNSNGTAPDDFAITFKAYIASRTSEQLTQASSGSGYGAGFYQVELGNFTTQWAVGDTLVVEFTNSLNSEKKTINAVLNSANPQLLDVTLQPKIPQSIAIAAPVGTVAVGESLQFTATVTYDDASTSDITATATWSVNAAVPVGAAAFDTAVQGKLNALKQGTADVKATLGAVSSSLSTKNLTAFAGTVEVNASPTSMIADGQTTSVISATIKTSGGAKVVDGVPVSFALSTGTGTVTASAVTTNGVATASYKSSTKAGSEVVTATVGTRSGTATVTLAAGAANKISVTAEPSIISSSVAAISDLVATILDFFDNVVASFVSAVTFSVDSTTFGNITGGTTVTPQNGIATNQLRSNVTTGGNIVVHADATGLVGGTVTVTTMPFGILTPVFSTTPVSIRTGSAVLFTGTGGSGSFRWHFSTGTPADVTQSTPVTWNAPTAATTTPTTVTVTLTDAGNATFTTSATFSVYYLPNPVLTNVATITWNNRPTMSWTAPQNASVYDFQLATDAGFQDILSAYTQTGIGATSFTPASTQVLPEGTYYWQVSAIDALGNRSSWVRSTAFTVDTTPPPAVTNLLPTQQTTGDIQLNWTNPNPTATPDFAGVLVVSYTDSLPTFTPVNGTTYTAGQTVTDKTGTVILASKVATATDTSLVNNTHRYYSVFAYDNVKNYSAVASTDQTSKDTAAPALVTAFAATAGEGQVSFTWTNPAVSDFAGTIILYKKGSALTGTDVPVAGTNYSNGDTIGSAKVGFKGAKTDLTATIANLEKDAPHYFAIYAFDEVPNYATAATANATPFSFKISSPALPTDVHTGDQLTFAALGGTGSYQWTFGGGTPATANTASVTWTAPATVAASPTAVAVTLTDPIAQLTRTGTINVYSSVAISNKPSTTPTILAGTNRTFQAAGGDNTYTWTVKDPAGVVGAPQTGASFTFSAPTTANFAGAYTIAVSDSRGGKDNFTVNVPFTLTPPTLTFPRHVPQNFTVVGATGNYTWDILDAAKVKLTSLVDYGNWTKASPVIGDAVNIFTAANVTTNKVFYLQITIDGNPALTALNGLNKQTFGPFQIVPTTAYNVNVKKADGTALSGAIVALQGQTPVSTGADGKVTFILPDGGKYLFTVSLTSYVTQSVSSTDKTITVTLPTAAASIKGTVVPLATAGATVTAYIPAALATQYQATTAADGAYTINLPADAAATGWVVVANKAGYVTGKVIDKASGATGVDFALATLTGAAPDVDAAGGSRTSTTNNETAVVTVPAGGLARNALIIINQTSKTVSDSKFTVASPGYVYEVKAQDAAAGTALAAADIKRIVIAIPLDITVVKPGDLEKGLYSVYTAATLADLEAGKITIVPIANILSTDYVGDGRRGSVTFWVDHLSFFAVGAGGAPGTDSGSSSCFIATAAYGSYLEEPVQILRDFRDAFLLPSSMGRAFVSFYYRHSPPVADFIAKHDTLRAVVRVGLAPAVAIGYVALYTTGMQKVMILILFCAFIIGASMIARRGRRLS